MIDRAHDLPITRQAEALNISRSSVYYLPRPVSEADLAIMRRLDRLHGRGVQDRPPSCEDADATRSSLLHAAAPPLGSLTPAEAPLIEAEKLFRQPAPALSHDLNL